MSRDRRITNRKRNKLTIIAIAGVMTTATAASAAAAAWPSGSSANAAFAKLNVPSAASAASAADQTSAQQNYLSVQRARAAANHQAVLTMLARQAAAKAAAATKAQAAAAAKQAAARQAAQAAARQAVRSSSQQTASATAPAPSGSAQTIAKQMLASFGWPASQFSCLEPLWAHESGWSVTASNPSTGAYGIAQALPGSRMASAGPDWQTNAATQIKWGLGYIKDTYGSPCAAESHEQADGWY